MKRASCNDLKRYTANPAMCHSHRSGGLALPKRGSARLGFVIVVMDTAGQMLLSFRRDEWIGICHCDSVALPKL